MPAPVFVAESGGPRIYKLGRVGLDAGTMDDGGTYTGLLRTERSSPVGEDGLANFRRVAVRIFHTGFFNMTAKIFVDGEQTQIYAAKQYVANPVFLDLWTQFNAPILIGEQNDPLGGAAGYYIEDDDGTTNTEYIGTTVSLGETGQYVINGFVKKTTGTTAGYANFRLYDVTGAAERAAAHIASWDGAMPVLTVSAGSLVRMVEYPDDWWNIVLLSSTCTGANTHRLEYLPADGGVTEVGSLYIFGGNVLKEDTGQFHGVQILDVDSVGLADQVVYAGRAAPTSGTKESIVEFDVNATGTYVEVELTVTSTRINGTFLPESVEYHYKPVRVAKSRSAAAT